VELGYGDDFTALTKTPTFDQALAEKCHAWLYDYMVVVPILNRVNAYVVKSNIHGAEYGYWALGTQWLPESAWMSK
jgi:hypothetical protein